MSTSRQFPLIWGGNFPVDTLTPEERSQRMSRIHDRNTMPEMAVRRLVHSMGYRYRLHRRDLPGRPDLAFISRRKALFVHGCFWHRHEGCALARLPKSRLDFWIPKLQRNKCRDAEKQAQLEQMGWRFLVIWECEIKHKASLAMKIKSFLSGDV